MNVNIFTIKSISSYEGFHEFMNYYRDCIECPLHKQDEIQKYKDITIGHILSVKDENIISALPQRLITKTCCFDSPIISYGCICLSQDNITKEDHILLVKRRDSVSYIDLLQGNYRISQLFLILQNIPNEEREKLLQYDFDKLWKDLRMDSEEMSYNYIYARSQFEKISPHLQKLFSKFPSLDPNGTGMWGFPKGRPLLLNVEELKLKKDDDRKLESPIVCALREFEEETNGICLKDYKIVFSDPISEIYAGTNNKNYQTHYFVIRLPDMQNITQFEKENTGLRFVTSKESAHIEWVPVSKLSSYLKESRHELCKYIIDKEDSTEKIKEFNEIWKNPVVIADDFTPTLN